MNKHLYIFVENFSNSKREEFFEKELPIFVNHFEKITIIPLYGDNKILNYEHPKIEIKQFDAFSECNRIKIFFRHFFLIFKIYFYELGHTHNKAFYFKNFKSLISTLIFRINSAEKIQKEIEINNTNAVFYSYWFNQWAFILTILKMWNPSLKIVSRVHGSDYNEEQIHRILPFRYFQLNVITTILPVSEYAKNYLVNKFNISSDKVKVFRLGLSTVAKLAPINKDKLTIVSCSSLIPLKRVHLISEILKHISLPVDWLHFGTGEELQKIKNINTQLPPHINVKMMGYIENKKFIEYLENNAFSFFINVSENEGIPVSLMEAANCGIPLIGTSVCGIPEVVTIETGTLIPLNFEPKDVANFIEKKHLLGDIYKSETRIKIQNFCHNYFSAQKNHTQLAKFLSELN